MPISEGLNRCRLARRQWPPAPAADQSASRLTGRIPGTQGRHRTCRRYVPAAPAWPGLLPGLMCLAGAASVILLRLQESRPARQQDGASAYHPGRLTPWPGAARRLIGVGDLDEVQRLVQVRCMLPPPGRAE